MDDDHKAPSNFHSCRCLAEDETRVALLGTMELPSASQGNKKKAGDSSGGEESGSVAVALVTRSPVDAVTASRVLKSVHMTKSNENDAYSTWQGEEGCTTWKVEIIVPANEDHERKYSSVETVVVRETPELYKSSHLPIIEAIPESSLQWVRNVLDKSAEADLLIHEKEGGDGFTLHPDMKWDGNDVACLHCVAITRNAKLRSVRDIRRCHLPLLRELRQQCVSALKNKYGIEDRQLRIFVHYPPTYYHFHVHFCNCAIAGVGQVCGRAILLDDIIDIVALAPHNNNEDWEYYLNASISMSVRSESKLMKAITASLSV